MILSGRCGRGRRRRHRRRDSLSSKLSCLRNESHGILADHGNALIDTRTRQRETDSRDKAEVRDRVAFPLTRGTAELRNCDSTNADRPMYWETSSIRGNRCIADELYGLLPLPNQLTQCNGNEPVC